MDAAQLTLEDRLAIAELTATYSHRLDAGDVAAVVATFTEDGVFDIPGFDLRFSGRDALTRFFTENVARDRDERHFTANPLVEGDGTRASHRCYYQVVLHGDRGVKATGSYEDELVKVQGAWKFRWRTVLND
ncbi:MAG TPA: nuclear transport factor 2 family protein [Pseudomonadales bacterium]|nr:nuclear transport factor 2 family protein [Pseudomonadales bacterium]